MKPLLYLWLAIILAPWAAEATEVCSDIVSCYSRYSEQTKMGQDSGKPFLLKDIERCLKESRAVKDIARGYLSHFCNLITHDVEAAIFTGSSNKRYLLVTHAGGSVCLTDAFRIDKSHLVDVKKSVIPNFDEKFLLTRYQERFSHRQITDKDFQSAHSETCLRLPRFGTTINVVSYQDTDEFFDKLLFQLVWDKKHEKFLVR
jgi:hypothetical protein